MDQKISILGNGLSGDLLKNKNANKALESTAQEPPKIEYPCENYPIKIMGEASDELFDFVMETTESFAPDFDRSQVNVKESSKGRFNSITVFITATSPEQLDLFHKALRKNTAIKIVL